MNIITINTTPWAEDDFTVVTDMPIELLNERVSKFVSICKISGIKRWNKEDIIEFLKDSFFANQYFLQCVENDAQYISV
jgi:hypothetical protein